MDILVICIYVDAMAIPSTECITVLFTGQTRRIDRNAGVGRATFELHRLQWNGTGLAVIIQMIIIIARLISEDLTKGS